VRKTLLIAALLLATGPVSAAPGGWSVLQLLPQVQGDRRHMPPSGGRERSEGRRGLREDVRDVRLPRDDAGRQSRDRSSDRDGDSGRPDRRRMSREERDQMRRDIHEANRNLRKR